MEEKKYSVDSNPKTNKSIPNSHQKGSEDNQTRTFTDIIIDKEEVLKLTQKSIKQRFDEIYQKDRRRSRNDPIGRDYKCGCGKMYLSYPALFGHIKQKHGGNKVQGTQKPMALNKRGRPRKDGSQKQSVFVSNNQSPFSKILQLNLDTSCMELFIEYQQIVEGCSQPELHMRYLKFKKHISKIKEQQIKILSHKMVIDQVFSIYLYNLAPYCNSLFFNFLEQAFICFRSCLNQNCLKILKVQSKIFTCEAIIKACSDQQFTEINSCEFLPLACDFFLLNYAPKKIKKFDQKLLTCIVQDFCQWLLDLKLTQLRLSKNIDKKPSEEIFVYEQIDDKQ